MGDYYTKTKKEKNLERLLGIIGLIALLAVVSVGIARAHVNYSGYDVAYEKYLVKSGDTVWEIAKEFYRDEFPMNFEKYCYEIEKHNNIQNHLICAGEYIYIPIYTKK